MGLRSIETFDKGCSGDGWQRSETHFGGPNVGWVPMTLWMRPPWFVTGLLYA